MLLRWFPLCLLIALLTLPACAPVGQAREDKLKEADVHYKMAAAHLQSDNPTMALKELLLAVQKDPKNGSIHVALAQAYQQKKAYMQAEKHYLKALELSDNEPSYQNNLASLYLDMKQWDKAIDYFDKASQNLLFLTPHTAVAGKGYAYFQKGDYPKSLAYYREAVALSPRYAHAYYLQSQVYEKLEQPTREKAMLRKAIDVAPQFLQARYRLAVLLANEDQFNKAEEQLQTIVKFAPNSDWGLRATELLRTFSH